MSPLIEKLRIRASFFKRVAGGKLFESASTIDGLLRLRTKPERLRAMRFLFVLAHPRSGSTLLGHLLMSHPEVLGYGENHSSYHSEAGLFRLASRTALRTGDHSLAQRYISDKVVWPRYALAESILSTSRTRFVFNCREPAPTFLSMGKIRPEWREEGKCLKAYLDCLDWLESTARRIDDPGRCFLVCYRDLLADPEPVLAGLTEFLGLRTPITTNYSIGRTTGKLRFGDNSENIRTGRILPRMESTDWCFSKETMETANRRYARFRDAMEVRTCVPSIPTHSSV